MTIALCIVGYLVVGVVVALWALRSDIANGYPVSDLRGYWWAAVLWPLRIVVWWFDHLSEEILILAHRHWGPKP